MKEKYILLTKNNKNYTWKYQTQGNKSWCEYKAGQFRLKNILVKILKIIL